MNIAFPALLLVILVLPGILFYYSYRKGTWRSPVSLDAIQNELAKGIFFALVIHLVTLLYIESCLEIGVSYYAIFNIITSYKIDDLTLSSVSNYPYRILLYFLSTNVIAYLAGLGLHKFVRWLKLDLRYDNLRFDNEWYYLFSGEARVFRRDEKNRKINVIWKLLEIEIDHVVLTAVVEQGGKNYLYWGILSEFYFNSVGKLDKLVLNLPQRRLLSNDDETTSGGLNPIKDVRFYSIVSDYFVLRSENIKNLNIEYHIIEEERPSRKPVNQLNLFGE